MTTQMLIGQKINLKDLRGSHCVCVCVCVLHANSSIFPHSLFYSVVHSVSALSEDFWGDVAHKMGKHFTPEDCRHQYLQFGGNPTSQSHKRNNKNYERGDDCNNSMFEH